MRTTLQRIAGTDDASVVPPGPVSDERIETVRELAKFTAAVALLAILADASIGHALGWENDPYWTYWITKTFLIATIFGLGTAWFGIGPKQGAVITVVHTIVLTVYYWSFSPIGLPSAPDWLDLEHTWVTGVPVHFGVIYLGYLGALWLWRRRPAVRDAEPTDLGAEALRALGAAVAIVVVSGLLEAVALTEFQGVTWYITRLLICTPFILAWRAVAGRDRVAAVGGAVTLTAVLTAYGHFLGPIGLPDLPLRVFELDAPGATAHWLTYRQEFLVGLPIALVVTLAVMLALSWSERRLVPVDRRPMRLGAIVAVILSVVGAVAAFVWVAPAGDLATVRSAGRPGVEQGAWYGGNLTSASGSMTLDTRQVNPRVTPLPPHNQLTLTANLTTAQGKVAVRATRPMVEDPLGRFTTWWGVGYDVWHHGRSGIGTSLLPPIHSDVAIFAVGNISLNGKLVASGVPIHAMTTDDNRLELDVGQPTQPIVGLHDGHLRAMWTSHSESIDDAGKLARYVYGALVLLGALILVGGALVAQRPRSPAAR